MKDRISVATASKLLGTTPQTVRLQMQDKDIDIGECIPNRKHTGYLYYIYKGKLEKVLGREIKDDEI